LVGRASVELTPGHGGRLRAPRLVGMLLCGLLVALVTAGCSFGRQASVASPDIGRAGVQ